MRLARSCKCWAAAWLLVGLGTARLALGNGGPFVVKYPGGDPAAKGVLARLDPSLKPTRETRLRVEKEDLAIQLDRSPLSPKAPGAPPLAHVSAVYTIANPTGSEVEMDFGFPILRGIFISPFSMRPLPEVQVTVDGKRQQVSVLSNSLIYGLVRRQSRGTIEKAIAADPRLSALVAAVRRAAGPTPAPSTPQPAGPRVQAQASRAPREQLAQARRDLRAYLVSDLSWNERDAALMVEYAGLDLGPAPRPPFDRWDYSFGIAGDPESTRLSTLNLGVLAAIGEQKATQMLARLAAQFDRSSVPAYEEIFAAWGGEIRERSVDMTTGEVRPREITAPPAPGKNPPPGRLLGEVDPTVYARVDYLDPNAKLTDTQKDSCRAILANLPVVFTFAPMNLLHYRVTFPPHSSRVVAVSYRQFAYSDTHAPASYQLAYVLHPASFWNDFGPIHLEVRVPVGVSCAASVALERDGEVTRPEINAIPGGKFTRYRATLVEKAQKTGELFVAVDQAAWDSLPGPGPGAKAVAGGPAVIVSPPTSAPAGAR